MLAETLNQPWDQASPGWDEFEPYQGYDDMFSGNET